MRRLVFILIAALTSSALHAAPNLPKVLFFSNPMTSDNDVIRRPQPDVLSVAERHFAEISQGKFQVTMTQDGAEISRDKLGQYQAVVFFTAIHPPGVDQEGLIEWVRNGGAFAGIHSTANTFQNNPAFGEMLGAFYDRRPWRTREHPQTKVRLIIEDKAHPATRDWGESFEIADDIYQFKNFDRKQARLLIRLDPESLDMDRPNVNREDPDLPVAWAKTHGEGRVFYTALGDWEETWKDPRFRKHLSEGIKWTMKFEEPQ
jgi:uncharacterized protein